VRAARRPPRLGRQGQHDPAETARLEGHANLEGDFDRVDALCVLPDGRLASAAADHTIRVWDVTTGAETARLEADASLLCVTALANRHLVASDSLGRLHWLEVAAGLGPAPTVSDARS
jgi:WD40 repeat protein